MMRASASRIIEDTRAVYRRRAAMLQPDDVLKSCRGAVEAIRKIVTTYKESNFERAMWQPGANAMTIEATTLMAMVSAFDLLDGLGFFDVDGALSRCDETQPCRPCKALFALRAASGWRTL